MSALPLPIPEDPKTDNPYDNANTANADNRLFTNGFKNLDGHEPKARLGGGTEYGSSSFDNARLNISEATNISRAFTNNPRQATARKMSSDLDYIDVSTATNDRFSQGGTENTTGRFLFNDITGSNIINENDNYNSVGPVAAKDTLRGDGFRHSDDNNFNFNGNDDDIVGNAKVSIGNLDESSIIGDTGAVMKVGNFGDNDLIVNDSHENAASYRDEAQKEVRANSSQIINKKSKPSLHLEKKKSVGEDPSLAYSGTQQQPRRRSLALAAPVKKRFRDPNNILDKMHAAESAEDYYNVREKLPLTMDSYLNVIETNVFLNILSWENPLETAVVFFLGILIFMLNTIFNISIVTIVILVIIGCAVDVLGYSIMSELSSTAVQGFVSGYKAYVQTKRSQFTQELFLGSSLDNENSDGRALVDLPYGNALQTATAAGDNKSIKRGKNVYLDYLNDISTQLTIYDKKYLKKTFFYQMQLPHILEDLASKFGLAICDLRGFLGCFIALFGFLLLTLIYPPPLIFLVFWVLAFIIMPLNHLIKIYIGDDFNINRIYTLFIIKLQDAKDIFATFIKRNLSDLIRRLTLFQQSRKYGIDPIGDDDEDECDDEDENINDNGRNAGECK